MVLSSLLYYDSSSILSDYCWSYLDVHAVQSSLLDVFLFLLALSYPFTCIRHRRGFLPKHWTLRRLPRSAESVAKLPNMNSEEITKEFEGVLKKCTKSAVCGRQFILVDKLQKWLRTTKDPSEPEGTTHADLLLHVAFGSRKLPGPPVDSNVLLSGDRCCLLIFCILQQIGCVKALPFFSRSEKVDRLLPLRPDSVRNAFKAACNDHPDLQAKSSSLIDKFLNLQYHYCPAKFDLYHRADWDDEHTVVPICRKKLINKKGGTAELWQIAIPEEFVGHKLRDISSGSRFDANANNGGKDTEPEWVSWIQRHRFRNRNRSHWFSASMKPS